MKQNTFSRSLVLFILLISLISIPILAQKSQETATVSVTDTAFEPAQLSIAIGTIVVWTNTGSLSHTTTSDTGVWDSGVFANSFNHTFNEPGIYNYHCSLHPNMQGTITVVGPQYLPYIHTLAQPTPTNTATVTSTPTEVPTATTTATPTEVPTPTTTATATVVSR